MPHLLAMTKADAIEGLNAALADRYSIERELGEGGMATVYLGKDLRHNRNVALKVLKPELTAVVGADRFLAEIETTASLQHPHILPLFDSGEAGTFLFYVMPYIEGESLRQRLNRERQLPVEEAVRIARKVAGALDHAHSRGVIHRDVKPSNILVARGDPLLADFGIAVRLRGDQGQRLTLSGSAPGTPAYMSPEQLDGAGRVDERTDIYGLACVLFEMLCGTPPHESSGVWAMIARRLTGPAPSLRGRLDAVPEWLEDALGSALDRDLSRRTASVAAFAESLAPSGEDRWAPPPESTPSRVMSGPSERSVAVLPFSIVGSGDTDDFLSEGIGEDLRGALAATRGLRVISRTSSMALVDQDLPAHELASRLGVANIVEGSVQRGRDLIRVSARLVDADTDSHRWSGTYEVGTEEALGVHQEIAAEVARALGAAAGTVVPSREPLPKARALYLQARHIGNQITGDRISHAIDLYEQALEIDPEYAAAWDGLALRYTNLANKGLAPEENWRRARTAASKALELDPDLAPAHGHLGWVAMCGDGDLAQAAHHYERALALDPNDSDVLGGAAMLAQTLGQIDAAIRLKEEVVSRDPVKPIGHANLGIGCFYAGRLDEAEEHLRMALALSPGYSGAHFMIGLARLRGGSPDDALREVEEEEFEPFRLIGSALVHAVSGAEGRARAILDDLIRGHADGWSYNIGYIFATLGESDAAFEWLERARRLQDPGLTDVLVQPFLEGLHRDARWPEWLEDIGRAPYQLAGIRFDPLGALALGGRRQVEAAPGRGVSPVVPG